MTAPVWLITPLAKWKPSHVWWCAPSSNEIPPQLAPPPSNVTPPVVSARTVTGLVRLAYREPIQSESDACDDDGLTWYLPFTTTISSTVLSVRAVISAGIEVTRTDLMAG